MAVFANTRPALRRGCARSNRRCRSRPSAVDPLQQLPQHIALGPHRQMRLGRSNERTNTRAGARRAARRCPRGSGVGGRRDRDGPAARRAPGGFAQAQIFRAEVVAPLRDAMGLVDREERPRLAICRACRRAAPAPARHKGGAGCGRRFPRDASALVRVGRRIQRRGGHARLLRVAPPGRASTRSGAIRPGQRPARSAGS